MHKQLAEVRKYIWGYQNEKGSISIELGMTCDPKSVSAQLLKFETKTHDITYLNIRISKWVLCN